MNKFLNKFLGATLGGALLVCILALLSLGQTTLRAAELEVTLDRESIRFGESFTVIFQSHKWVNDEPDFSPLQHDFEVLSSQRSQTFRIRRGKSVQENRWQVTLTPRRPGILLIPSIRFGNDVTPERAIQILPATAPVQQVGGDKVFIEVEVEPRDPYVQAPVLCTVRLFRALQLRNASLSEPRAVAGNLRVEKLGDSRYEAQLNGETYLVNELRYLLIPQASGALELAPIEFKGEQGRGRQFVFDPSNLGVKPLGADSRLVLRRSDPIPLQVRPIPAQFPPGAHWMPAHNLRLGGSWAQEPPLFRAGEPSTLILSLQAEGLYSSQLALPDWPLPEGLRSYPDQPQLKDLPSDQGLRSVREDRIALIPQRPGNFTLSALEIPWWNLQADQLEYARLPAQQIQVTAGSALPASPGGVAMPKASADAAVPTPLIGAGPLGAALAPAMPGPTYLWGLVLALTLAWLLTLYAWSRAHRRMRGILPASPAASAKTGLLRAAQVQLRRACNQNQPDQVRSALLGWARQRWPQEPPLNLHQLAQRIPPMQAEFQALDRALYRAGTDWQSGRKLWQAFCQSTATMKSPGTTKRRSVLPKLHRIESSQGSAQGSTQGLPPS